MSLVSRFDPGWTLSLIGDVFPEALYMSGTFMQYIVRVELWGLVQIGRHIGVLQIRRVWHPT